MIVKYFIDGHDYVSRFFVLIEMITTSPYGWHGALRSVYDWYLFALHNDQQA